MNFNVVWPGDLRLVDGKDQRSGRLEIYHDGIWGTICGYQFSNMAATVACKQLGL